MKVGVVGAGGMGAVHSRHWASVAGVELYVFDLDDSKRDELASQYGMRATNDLDKLIQSVDIVDVCVPTDLHADVAVASLGAKRATLVEKPLARTMDDAERIVSAAKKSGVALGIGHVVRYFPEHESIRNAIQRGVIGTPAAARLRRGGGLPRNYDGWFSDQGRSGGVLLDLAIHDFDWILWALGPVKSVYARSVTLGKGVAGADFKGDHALATLSLESGAVAHVEATWMDPSGGRAAVEVAGSKGLVEFDSRNCPSVRIATPGVSRTEAPNGPGLDPYYRQLKSFHDAIERGEKPPVGPEEGLAALQVALAAVESAKSHRMVSITT